MTEKKALVFFSFDRRSLQLKLGQTFANKLRVQWTFTFALPVTFGTLTNFRKYFISELTTVDLFNKNHIFIPSE